MFKSLYYSMEWGSVSRYVIKKLQDQTGQISNLFDAECVSLSPTVPIETTFTLDTYIHRYANFRAVTHTAALPPACKEKD